MENQKPPSAAQSNKGAESSNYIYCPKCNNAILPEMKECPKCHTIIFGLFLGTYSGYWHIPVAAIKVPLLLFGTLFICTPALYTFNILLGSKLSFKQTLCMLLISTYLISFVLVSLSLILFFFIISTNSHDFITLLNVISFSVAGFFGVALLWDGMKYLTVRSGYEPNMTILKTWSVIYMFVGTQLAWTLRPFVGAKDQFALFRKIEGNFYLYLFQMITGFFK